MVSDFQYSSVDSLSRKLAIKRFGADICTSTSLQQQHGHLLDATSVRP